MKKIIKIAQVNSIRGDVSFPLNKMLGMIQRQNNEIIRIKYICNPNTGTIFCAIIEYLEEICE